MDFLDILNFAKRIENGIKANGVQDGISVSFKSEYHFGHERKFRLIVSFYKKNFTVEQGFTESDLRRFRKDKHCKKLFERVTQYAANEWELYKMKGEMKGFEGSR